MKQVARYSRFLFSIVFRRWSYYVSTFVYLIVLAAVLFLVSAITKKPISLTLMYYGFNMMVILAGAIVASIYAVQLFRAGIDDGTELLITAKPINRKEMLLGKCIVLLTLILTLSILSMMLGFLTYYTINGEQYYTYVGAGVFLTTLLILLFFSGVALVFCLITKKMGATLATIGTCFLFMIYCFIDTILSTAPSEYTNKNNIGISQYNLVKKINDKEKSIVFDSTYGAIANDKITNNAIIQYKNSEGKYVKANNLFLHDLWERALLGTSRYAMLAVDPIFQWSELLNLQNYLLNDYQLSYFYQSAFESNLMTNANLKFSTKPIDFNNYENITLNIPINSNSNKLLTNNNNNNNHSTKFVVDFSMLQNTDISAKYISNYLTFDKSIQPELSKKIYIPKFNPLTYSSNSSNNDIDFQTYNLSNVDWKVFHDMLFVKDSTKNISIVEKYANDFKNLIKENLISNMKPLNTISCVQTYLNNGFIEMLNNPKYLNKFQEFSIHFFKKEIKLVNISDLNELWNMIKTKPKDFFKELFFISILSLNTLKQIQLTAFNYLKSASTNSVNFKNQLFVDAMKILGINSIIPTLNYNYAIFLVPYKILDIFTKLIPTQTKIAIDNEIVRYLIQIVEACLIKFDSPPIFLMNRANLVTFTELCIIPFISLGGLLGVWFSITFILLVIGTILYSRKDFI